MFHVFNAVLLSCAITVSSIAADNVAPAKKPSSLLSDYRLTWDINSAAWGWNIDSTVDIEEVRKFTSSISSTEANETGYAGQVKISTGSSIETRAGLAFIGIPHSSMNVSARTGFDKETSSYLNNTSRKELKNIAEAISLYSKRVHLSKMHLSFTVTFLNLTDEDVELRCTSVPVRCGGEHYVDAAPIQGKETITIPGGRSEGIDVMFRAELDTTKAISLINAMQENNLEINILRGQIKGLAKDGTELISETSKKSVQTNRLNICTSDSNKSILSWCVSNSNELRVKTPIKAIFEEINRREPVDDNGAKIFKIDGEMVSGVGLLPIVGNKAILLAISSGKTELLSDLDLSKPIPGDLTIFCLLTTNTSGDTLKKYVTGNVVAGLLKLAEKDNQYARRWLGICYYNGYGVEKNIANAIECYRKAAEQGDADAQCSLGLCYYNGSGIAKDTAEAVKWYRKAAEQGLALAQNNLGVCYANGNGVSKDAFEAVKWYRKAAEQGLAQAQNNLGGCYYEGGNGVSKDASEAVKWYRKAAEQGNWRAQFCLSNCYSNGNGVEKNFVEALKWLRKAAEQGNADVQYILGDRYYNGGNGVSKDASEAVKWYRKAAEQGNWRAQYDIGRCYQNGEGVAKDMKEAIEWYFKAADVTEQEIKSFYDEDKSIKLATNDASCSLAKAYYYAKRCNDDESALTCLKDAILKGFCDFNSLKSFAPIKKAIQSNRGKSILKPLISAEYYPGLVDDDIIINNNNSYMLTNVQIDLELIFPDSSNPEMKKTIRDIKKVQSIAAKEKFTFVDVFRIQINSCCIIKIKLTCDQFPSEEFFYQYCYNYSSEQQTVSWKYYLNQQAWSIFMKTQKNQYEKAYQLASESVSLAYEQDISSLDTKARLAYELGKKDEARNLESQAIKIIKRDYPEGAEKAKRLQVYESALNSFK